MTEPYQVVGLISTMRGIRRREEIAWNLEHISHMVKAASWLSSMDLAVRLICIPEGGLQGFTDEVLDLDHETYALECAIDIPRTRNRLPRASRAAVETSFVIAQAKARRPFPTSSTSVVVDPRADRDSQAPRLRSAASSRALRDTAQRGRPVGQAVRAAARCGLPGRRRRDRADGSRWSARRSCPENARGLAMNGCEIAYRGPYPAPGVMTGMFFGPESSPGARQQRYVIGMNLGTYYLNKDYDHSD